MQHKEQPKAELIFVTAPADKGFTLYFLSMTMKTLLSRILLVIPLVISLSRSESPVCSVAPEEDGERDPALRQMIYNIGEGEQSTYVYVEPDIDSFYQGNPPASTKVTPKHVSDYLF